jgi:hypothetical protein
MMCQYGAWISTCLLAHAHAHKVDPAAAEGVLNLPHLA